MTTNFEEIDNLIAARKLFFTVKQLKENAQAKPSYRRVGETPVISGEVIGVEWQSGLLYTVYQYTGGWSASRGNFVDVSGFHTFDAELVKKYVSEMGEVEEYFTVTIPTEEEIVQAEADYAEASGKLNPPFGLTHLEKQWLEGVM